MALVYIIVLAIVQGITEFLPVSSSAHLVLTPIVMDVKDQGILMDISVHVGTLLAVLLYVFRDLLGILTGLFCQDTDKKIHSRKLLACLIIATIPVVLAGAIMHFLLPDGIRSIEVIAYSSIVFGLFLWWADTKHDQGRDIKDITFMQAFMIGIGQVFALIPGTSRSGVTMTVARIFQLNRIEAARFSLLLSIPAITGAGLLVGIDAWKMGDADFGMDLLWGIILSFFSALIAITLMMKWLQKFSFTPFVIYRIFLGIFILGFLYL